MVTALLEGTSLSRSRAILYVFIAAVLWLHLFIISACQVDPELTDLSSEPNNDVGPVEIIDEDSGKKSADRSETPEDFVVLIESPAYLILYSEQKEPNSNNENNYEPDESALESLEAAVEKWIEKHFLDYPNRGKFDYYYIEMTNPREATVVVGMDNSEPDFILEYIMTANNWLLSQQRATPHSGYDVIEALGKPAYYITDLFGTPSRIYDLETINVEHLVGSQYHYYNHLRTGYLIGGEPAKVLGVESFGYYQCFYYNAGDKPDTIISSFGPPTSQGYSDEAKISGYPPHLILYDFSDTTFHAESTRVATLFDLLFPELEIPFKLYLFSESEEDRIKVILAVLLD